MKMADEEDETQSEEAVANVDVSFEKYIFDIFQNTTEYIEPVEKECLPYLKVYSYILE